MDKEPFLVGASTQGRWPRWEPLERAVGIPLAGSFMWMFEVQTADGRRVQAYKHIFTRNYLHLDDEVRAYLYLGEHGDDGRYRRVPLAEAIELALRPWWEELDATPDDIADAHDAIGRAWDAEEAAPCNPRDAATGC